MTAGDAAQPPMAGGERWATGTHNGAPRLFLATGAAALLCSAVILYAHRESPRTLVSAHGLLHTAIAQRLEAASLRAAPPENPFFAAERLPYYWFFHYLGAWISRLARVHVLHAFEMMILAAVCITWFAAATIGRRLYGGIFPGLATGLLAFGGANPFGVTLLVGKVLLRGGAVLHDDPRHLYGIAHPVLSAARLNDPSDLHGPLINFFFNITSRPVALASLLVEALCLLAWVLRGRASALAGATISTALCTALSLSIGAPAALALAGALVVTHWTDVNGSRDGARAAQRRRATLAAALLLIGMLAASPTYDHLVSGGTEQTWRLAPSLSSVVTVAASAGLLLVLSTIGALRQEGGTRRFLLSLVMAAAVLLGGSMILGLPVENQTNLFHAAIFLLAAPAAGSFVPAAGWSRTRRQLTSVAMLIVFVPTPLLVMVAYLHRPAVALELTGSQLHRVPDDSALARLYAWVRVRTPSPAVFILDPGPPFITAVGNMPEFPALAERVMFTSYPTSYMVSPHRDAPLRHDIAKRLLAGQGLDDRQAEYVNGLQRPLYLVTTEADDDPRLQLLQGRYGPPLFRDRAVAVFGVDTQTMRTPAGASPPGSAGRAGPELTFATYIGGSGGEVIRDVAPDSAGNIYLTGGTSSADFPVTPGAYGTSPNGSTDVFVMKLDPSGQRIIWSTVLGGPNYDRAYAIELDAQSNIYVAGRAGADFPTTAGVVQPAFAGDRNPNALYGTQDGFVAKLSPDGQRLLWATYFGGNDRSFIRDLAVDAGGNAYVALCEVSQPNPHVAEGALQPRLVAGDGGVVAKLNPTSTRVAWATYVDGSGSADLGTPSIRVDIQGNVYVAGYTNSADLPTTPNAFDRTHNGDGDFYVAKIASDGSRLLYATYLGGSAVEFTETHGLAVDGQGQAIIGATTRSTDFPTTPGAFQRAYGGHGGPRTGSKTNYSGDGFIAKLSADGTHLLASTLLGGNYGDGIEGVSVDTEGNIYVSGATYSTNFPVTAVAAQPLSRGNGDFFAAKLSADLSTLLYGTYLGGSGTDYARTSSVDPSGNFVVAGELDSRDFPVRNAVQPAYGGGGSDGALARLTPSSG